ncbi:glycosyl hydrolase [Arthrobacter sp. D2-10]
MPALTATLLATLIVPQAAIATTSPLPSNSSVFTEEFADPSNENRATMRLWMPLAPIDDNELRAALTDIADRGFGSVEIGAFPVRGGSAATDGWNSDAWNDAMRTALALAAEPEIGLRVDFMVSANYPAATPSNYVTPDSAGSEKELAWGVVKVAAGSTFEAPAPAPIKAPAADVKDQKLVAVVATKLAPGQAFDPSAVGTKDYTSVNLDQSSTVVLEVPEDSSQPIAFTAPDDSEDWVLTSYWFRGSGAVVADITEPKSFVVDHLSKEGTNAWSTLWEQELLADPAAVDLLADNGGYLFEDSLHLSSYQLWTDDFFEEFKARRGYDLTPHLPAILVPDLNNFFVGRANADTKLGTFEFEPGVGQKIRNDYYQTLTDLYVENHIIPMREWAAQYNLGLRFQPSYGQSLEQSQAVFEIDVPETESFQHNNQIDAYRYTAAAAHASDRNLISTECCASFGGTNAFGWQNTLPIVEGNFAGGVNNIVFHGYSYNLSPDATWPGWIRFGQNSFSENYGKQPTWELAEPVADYLGRQQVALREGRQVTDVAVYRHSYSDMLLGTTPPKYYNDNGALQAAGYSYGFVSPDMLDLETFTVSDGRLDAEGAGYRSLIVDQGTKLTVDAAHHLLEAARAGFPILFIGAPPTESPFYAERDADIAGIVADILATGSAVQVADRAAVPAALEEASTLPDADATGATTAVPVRRSTESGDLYYLYNTATTPLTTTYALKGEGRPYKLDAWTGQITPIAEFTQSNGRTTVDVALEGNETTIIAISDEWSDKKLDKLPSVVSTTAAGGAEYTDKTITLLADRDGTVNAELSNGAQVTAQAKKVPTAALGTEWKLNVESWEQADGSNPYDIARVPSEHALTLGADGKLPAWTSIPGLEDVSGIGTYQGTLNVDKKWSKSGRVTLDLGSVYDTVRLTVNGKEVRGINPRNPEADISEYVTAGANTVQIEIGTTLRNRMRVITGEAATPSRGPRQAYGVFGPVSVTTYQEVDLEPGDWKARGR